MARAETDSMIEKGVMGVGEESVCASVQNMGGGGGGTTHRPSWTLCEVSLVLLLLIVFLFFEF